VDPQLLRDADLKGFALGAEVGDISPTIPWMNSTTKEHVGYQVHRLNDRRLGEPPPPFAHREVQNWLRRDYTRHWRESLFLMIDGPELMAGTYEWYHPLLRVQDPRLRGSAER